MISTPTPTAGFPTSASSTCVDSARHQASPSHHSRRSRRLVISASCWRTTSCSVGGRSQPLVQQLQHLLAGPPAARTRYTYPNRCSYARLPSASACTSAGSSATPACSRRDDAASRPQLGRRLADPRMPGEGAEHLVPGQRQGDLLRRSAQRVEVGTGPLGRQRRGPGQRRAAAADLAGGVADRQQVPPPQPDHRGRPDWAHQSRIRPSPPSGSSSTRTRSTARSVSSPASRPNQCRVSGWMPVRGSSSGHASAGTSANSGSAPSIAVSRIAPGELPTKCTVST